MNLNYRPIINHLRSYVKEAPSLPFKSQATLYRVECDAKGRDMKTNLILASIFKKHSEKPLFIRVIITYKVSQT